ncbi:MAG: alcohol dehydrogenase catalytic domain-containing protein [Bacteroidales bacterium]|nr:alcohol dehydrogenase catalytic domain-containing protein [Bacteroidales bacterium]
MDNKTYKAAILPEYNDNLFRALLSLKIDEKTVLKPGPDELLIKVLASPVNPSDLAFMRGGYQVVKDLPAVPGFEGAGEVVDAGGNCREWIGKKVSFFTQAEGDGAWAGFVRANKYDCLVLQDDFPVDQGACFSVNPFTAYGLFEHALLCGAEMIVQNAAGSRVAEFVRYFAKTEGIKTVNLIRKEKQGSKGEAGIFISTEDESYVADIKNYTEGKKVIVFDAVGGDATSLFVNELPEKSKIILFGGLGGGSFEKMDMMEILFREKTLTGFNLNLWRKNKTEQELQKISEKLQDIIINGQCLTRIQNKVAMNDIVKGIRDYIRNMSGGKVLIEPWR